MNLGGWFPKTRLPNLILSASEHFHGKNRKAVTSKTKVYLGFAISGGNVMTKQLADGLVIFAGPNIKTTFSGFVIYADVSAMKRQKVFFVLEKGRIKRATLGCFNR